MTQARAGEKRKSTNRISTCLRAARRCILFARCMVLVRSLFSLLGERLAVFFLAGGLFFLTHVLCVHSGSPLQFVVELVDGTRAARSQFAVSLGFERLAVSSTVVVSSGSPLLVSELVVPSGSPLPLHM